MAPSGDMPPAAMRAAARELPSPGDAPSCGEPAEAPGASGEPSGAPVEGVSSVRRSRLLERLPGVPLLVMEEVGVSAMEARPCRVGGWIGWVGT